MYVFHLNGGNTLVFTVAWKDEPVFQQTIADTV